MRDCEEGPNKKVKNEEEEVGGDGASLAHPSENQEGRRGTAREGEIRGRGRENVGDVV